VPNTRFSTYLSNLPVTDERKIITNFYTNRPTAAQKKLSRAVVSEPVKPCEPEMRTRRKPSGGTLGLFLLDK
jgi:hypothetical protein